MTFLCSPTLTSKGSDRGKTRLQIDGIWDSTWIYRQWQEGNSCFIYKINAVKWNFMNVYRHGICNKHCWRLWLDGWDFRGVYNPRKTHLHVLLWHCWEHQYSICQRDLGIRWNIFYPFQNNSLILVFFVTLGKPTFIKKRKYLYFMSFYVHLNYFPTF